MRRVAAICGALLVLLAIGGCKVQKNTNPQGKPDVECILTIDGKERRSDAATCKRCQVGAEYPDCKKERSNANEPAQPGAQPQPPGRGNKPPAASADGIFPVNVLVSSTNVRAYLVHIQIWDRNERPRSLGGQAVFASREATFRHLALCLTSDYKIRVTAEKPGVSDAKFSLSMSVAGAPGERMVASGNGGNGAHIDFYVRRHLQR